MVKARSLTIVFFLAATSLAIPTVAGQATQELGTLYLSSDGAELRADAYCPDSRRYDMSTNLSRIQEGEVQPGPTAPRLSCPVRFSYLVTSTFDLSGMATVVLNIRCPTASTDVPLLGSAQLLLTDDLHSQDPGTIAGGDPNIIEVPAGNTPCIGDQQITTNQLPTDGRSLRPGDILSLFVWLRLVGGGSTAPMVTIVAGGDDPSRIEAAGIPLFTPPFGQEPQDFRSRILWTGQLSNDVHCGVAFRTYAMVPDFVAVPPGEAVPTFGIPGTVGCRLYFAYTASENMSIEGRATLKFWYKCESNNVGTFFEVTLLAGTVQREGPITSNFLGETVPCDPDPREMEIELNIHPAIKLSAGNDLQIGIASDVATVGNSPPATHAVQHLSYLVGPDYPSGIALPNLPWAAVSTNDTIGPGAGATGPNVTANQTADNSEAQAEESPLGLLVMPAILIAAAAQRFGRGKKEEG